MSRDKAKTGIGCMRPTSIISKTLQRWVTGLSSKKLRSKRDNNTFQSEEGIQWTTHSLAEMGSPEETDKDEHQKKEEVKQELFWEEEKPQTSKPKVNEKKHKTKLFV